MAVLGSLRNHMAVYVQFWAVYTNLQ